ncbi:MAG: CotH kinase family protein [Bacteroidales bacterium]|nr:CotH kinase family protein [Bacteroidales bacterium]
MKRRFNLFMPLAAVLMMAACGNDMNGDDPRPEPQPEQPAPSAAHAVAVMDITTENGAPIKGKEKEDYVNCTISIDHPDDKWDYEGTGRIRGRGNSTWLWYDKKPYRIKLDEKASIVGLAAEKDWVLLANFRDPTHMMNTFVFELGHVMGLPYTNHSRYMEVNLNGEYIGLYQLTEQIEQGKNRVAVDDVEGVLIALDVDDGPEESRNSKDNFWSEVYQMPVCVKFPEDIDVTGIKKDFAQLESAILSIRQNKGKPAAIKAGMDKVRELLDVQSFIDFLIIQELIYNVELAAPRSMYMHKDKGGKWVMGPLWDFDAGFDFDWGTMTDGHHFFESYKEYVLGPDPIHHSGAYWVPEFFTDIFRSDEFCEEFIARWEEISPLIMTEVWDNTEKYITAAEDAMVRNSQRWPIYFPSDSWPQQEISFATEIVNMYSWLSYRVDHLTPIFNRYLQLD